MITYDFPPAQTSGIYRPVKFVKHLRSFGWEPVVMTVKNPYVKEVDYTLLKDIPPGVKVYRVFGLDLARINDIIYKLIFGAPPSSPLVTPQKSPPTGAPPKKSWLKRCIFSPLNRFIENWLYVPDSKIGWFPFALIGAIKLIRKEKPDVVYTTSAPPTTQLIGLALKLLFGKPWVVDLRDNWVAGYADLYNSRLRVKLDAWLLGLILKRADRVITMCQGNADDLKVQYPHINNAKFAVLTNGYDVDDFAGLQPSLPPENSNKLVLLHMGTLYNRTIGRFFSAVNELLAERPEMSPRLVINFIGQTHFTFPELIHKLQLEQTVNLLGNKDHPVAIRALLDSDVLLVFLGHKKNRNQQFPGKVFEYMYAQKTILVVGRPGEIWDAVSAGGCGVLAPDDNSQKIKDIIYELYCKKINSGLTPSANVNYIKQYEYRNITSRLAGILDRAISPPE